MEKEEWLEIKDWKGYQVSNFGQVRSYKKTGISNDLYIKPKILKLYISIWGYPEVRLSNIKKTKKFRVHRIVAENFILNNSLKKEVNHKDGNKLNNHFSNLEWVSRSENMVHLFRVSKSPTMWGEKNGHSKLTEIEVIDIKKLWKTGGYLQKELAEIYGVNRTTISAIVNNYNWKNLVEVS